MAPEYKGAGKRSAGRPRAFDRSTVLEEALKLFWERGYEGTSFDDLTTAMGISPSSFYNSFASKEQLYREAVQVYLARSGTWFLGALATGKDTRSAFRNVLTTAAKEFTRAGGPSGCMISLAATHVPPSLDAVRATMAAHRMGAQEALAARITKGIAAGDVPADTDVNALAAFYSALSRGLAVQARDGASTKRLLKIVDVAMRAWPSAD